MDRSVNIKWLNAPEKHDYGAAQSYLTLLFTERVVRACVVKLKRAPLLTFKAKDIFRASGLSLLGISNRHVKADRAKIRSGRQLSPLLLLRDVTHGKLIIADGYHRLCAVYSYDEDARIPCKIC